MFRAVHTVACKDCGRTTERDVQATCLHVLLSCPRASQEARTTAVECLLYLYNCDLTRAVATAAANGGDRTVVIRQTLNAWMLRLGPAAKFLEDESAGKAN